MRASYVLRLIVGLAIVVALSGAAAARVADDLRAPSAPVVHDGVRSPAADRLASARRAARSGCFGAAAAVDAAPACRSRLLRTTVLPTPADAEAAQRSEPCRAKQDIGLLRVCFWGAPLATATRTVALIGDSHASHWRAAMQTVVRAKRWRAISISRAGCPLTLARPDLPGRARTLACMGWNRAVQRWVRQHPRISVVFTGAHRGSVVAPPGRSVRAARRLGYLRAWQSLLGSGVRQIVVFRDTPRMTGAALRCVQLASSTGTDAGTDCALPRRYALPPDPEVEAASSARSPRIQVADLSRFFCGARVCAPVVGGALVLRDVSHMTTTFSATLGPYLLRTVDRLAASWR